MYENKINSIIQPNPETEKKVSFTKLNNNEYYGTFTIKNTNILLNQIINIELIKLLTDLNPDIFEEAYFEKINDKEATVIFILKHFFEDLGMPQSYMHLNLKKINTYTFEFTTIHNKPTNIKVTDDLKLLNITIINTYKIHDNHNGTFWYNINLNNNTNMVPIIEKMLSQIFIKIFKRLKQFIENIKIT